MSAFRQAMLSVPPERLEQFSLELKQKISAKKHKKSSSHHKHSKSKKSEKLHKKDKSSTSNGEKLNTAMSKKRKSSKDRKSRKKKRQRTPEAENLTGDSDIEENGLDLSVKLFPLSHYVKDRQELAGTLFRIVKGVKLVAMLPDNLKDMPLSELKQKCISHLEVMSSKRINHILVGETMHSSSGTDSEEESSQTNEAIAKSPDLNVNKNVKKIDDGNNLQTNFVDSTTSSGCEVLSLLAAGSERENVSSQKIKMSPSLGSIQETKQPTKAISESSASSTLSTPESSGKNFDKVNELPSDVEEEIEMVEVVEDDEYADMVDAMLEETLVPSDDQESLLETLVVSKNVKPESQKSSNDDSSLSQLELLELQLRARAIKSLMKATQTT